MGLEDAVASGVRTGSKAWITPNTVLGRMFELKEQDWVRYLDGCDKHGEVLPTTPQDLLEWAESLRPLPVRLALGVDRETALRMKTALKVGELAAYYRLLLSKVPHLVPTLDPSGDEEDDLPY